MHEWHLILIGLPYVFAAIGFVASVIGLIIGAVKFFSWTERTWPLGSWLMIVFFWILILLYFAWQIGIAYEH